MLEYKQVKQIFNWFWDSPHCIQIVAGVPWKREQIEVDNHSNHILQDKVITLPHVLSKLPFASIIGKAITQDFSLLSATWFFLTLLHQFEGEQKKRDLRILLVEKQNGLFLDYKQHYCQTPLTTRCASYKFTMDLWKIGFAHALIKQIFYM